MKGAFSQLLHTPVADEGVERGGAVPTFGIANEYPVLFADGGGAVEAPGRGGDSQPQAARRAKEPGATEANGVFGKVVVDLDAAVREEDAKFVPLAEGVGDVLTGEALEQVFAPNKEIVEPDFDFSEKKKALRGGRRRGRKVVGCGSREDAVQIAGPGC